MSTTFVGNPAPDFDLPCTGNTVPVRTRVSLQGYKGRWLVLVFYPRDFSLVCPTELIGLSQRIEDFAERDCDILAISSDTIELHDRWIAAPKSQGGLGGLNFPLASDVDSSAARAYGVHDPQKDLTVRGTFIIDPDGLIQYQVVHGLSVGRRSQEVLRVLAAIQSGGLCREDWMIDGATLDPYEALRPGRIFSHYFMESEIGTGTFSHVYLARDLQLARPVALKVFKPDCPVTPSTVLAEARSVAALNHPNICTVYAVDETAGLPVIAMEYVPGRSLADQIREAPIPLEKQLDIARQIAAGMNAAHEAGIVHGDLKPDNIMLNGEGLVKILDFGLARRLHQLEQLATDATPDLGMAESSDGVFGTPRYLAPEQTQGEPATFASDVFSFGIVLYELATQRPAFADGNLLQVLSQIRNINPKALADEVGGPLAPILLSMLAPDPSDRESDIRRIVAEVDAAWESSASLEADPRTTQVV